jgi:hypothetical protein
MEGCISKTTISTLIKLRDAVARADNDHFKYVIRFGHALAVAAEKAPHGTWKKLIVDNLNITYRSVRLYIKVSEAYDAGKLKKITSYADALKKLSRTTRKTKPQKHSKLPRIETIPTTKLNQIAATFRHHDEPLAHFHIATESMIDGFRILRTIVKRTGNIFSDMSLVYAPTDEVSKNSRRKSLRDNQVSHLFGGQIFTEEGSNNKPQIGDIKTIHNRFQVRGKKIVAI